MLALSGLVMVRRAMLLSSIRSSGLASNMATKKKTFKKEKFPVFCQMCGWNMSRSRVRFTNTGPSDGSLLERLILCTGEVRCNGCKQVFEVRITFPEPKEST
jgi:hypothetical protein